MSIGDRVMALDKVSAMLIRVIDPELVRLVTHVVWQPNVVNTWQFGCCFC